MTRTRARACTGKRGHATKTQAYAHRRRLIRAGAWPAALDVYHCPTGCGRWHVGHLGHRDRRRANHG